MKNKDGVVDGIGGTVKRTVYGEVMSGKRCNNASDFVRLIKDKGTAVIINELTTDDIDDAQEKLQDLFDNVKPVPNIQKLHSMCVAGVDTLKCKMYSNSAKHVTVYF